ncbi:hypothetical protein Zmor_022761 [Zophobas morio]|uniref:Carboxylesterase type B domain-containing protein n=1 Tax=Zophobas morio TaxID=2755281 RepID=A0AA38HVV7_9CUCU|nr:hypothetical protein Zmor_022761 [Zophobas morio]
MPLIESTIPWYFGYDNDSPEAQVVADKIKDFYFEGKEYSKKTQSEKFTLLTDAHFLHGLYVTVISHINHAKSPLFLYKLVLETELNFFKNLLDIKVPGPYHCDEIGYLFKNFTTPVIRTGSVEDISLRKFLRLWSNFAKFGNPTPEEYDPLLQSEWKPVTDTNLDFLYIGKTLTQMSNPDSERISFWKQLFSDSPAGKIANGSL